MQGSGLVLDLGSLFLAGDDDAGGQVGDADRGVSGVDALAAFAGGSVYVDTDVFVVDFDGGDFVGFGVDEDTGGGGLDSALGFGNRYALYSVYAAFEFEDASGAVAGRLFGSDG